MTEVERMLEYDVHSATKKYKPYRAGGDLVSPVRYIIKKLTTMLKDVASFLYRAVPNGVANGYGTIEKVEGNTLVWNQQMNITSSGTETYRGISFRRNGNGSVSVYGSSDGTGSSAKNFPFSFIAGHIYYVPSSKQTQQNVTCSANNTTYWNAYSTDIFTATTHNAFVIGSPNNNVITGEVLIWIEVFDLTQMFGAGNEPSTVAEFEALYPLNYYDYNAGELISNSMSGVKSYDSNNTLIDTKALDITTITGINSATNVREVCFPDGMNKANGEADVIDGDTATRKTDKRAYTAGDESDTTVVTDGTNTIYSLTTPITYTDLQDGNGNPLVLPKYEVEIGGTEEIQPVGTASSVIAPPTLEIVYNKPNA